MTVDTMKISDVISVLEEFKKLLGDVPVIHQSDPEGNSFGTVKLRSFSYDDKTKIGKAVFICPFAENIDDQLFDNTF